MGVKEAYEEIKDMYDSAYMGYYPSYEYDIAAIKLDVMEEVLDILKKECPEVLEEEE